MKKKLSIDIQTIIKKLRLLYKPECALNYDKPFELLAAVILSAQCTDKRVNIVTQSLFQKYKSIYNYADADINELEADIKSTGFYRNKAAAIIGCAQIIIEKYSANIPQSMDELIKLPGVGRKTANVILSELFNISEGIVVDTHVRRLSKRIGLTNESNPEKIEKILMLIIPQKEWIDFSHLMILHGRAVCIARNPRCLNCVIQELCLSAKIIS